MTRGAAIAALLAAVASAGEPPFELYELGAGEADAAAKCAPALRAALRKSVEVTFAAKSDARRIAAAIGGGTLPRKPKPVEERAGGRWPARSPGAGRGTTLEGP